MLHQVFPIIQSLLSKWLKDTEVVEVGAKYHLSDIKYLKYSDSRSD